MTTKRLERERNKRIILKGKVRRIEAEDLAALIFNMVSAIYDSKIGFNHATTDVKGWFRALAPHGLTLDDAFVEDMLYASNMLDELGKYKHPTNKPFKDLVRCVLKTTERFDLDTNEIKNKRE